MKALLTVALPLSLHVTSPQSFAHSWMAPQDAAQQQNPIVSSPESIELGRSLYVDYCLQCHGPNAAGLGKESTALKTATPNLVKRLATHSEGDFHWKILEGKGEMPSFSDELADEEVWHLLNYLKSVESK